MKKAFLVAAFLLALLFAGCVSQPAAASPNATVQLEQTATPTITPAPLQQVEINVTVSAPERGHFNSTIVRAPAGESAMEISARATQLGVKNYSFGAYVFSVEGINESNSDGLYWQFYFNGNLAPVGASDFKLSQNGTLEWRLEKPQLGG